MCIIQQQQHTQIRESVIYCVVRQCLVGKRFIIPLLNQQQKAKAEEEQEEEEAIGVVDVSGLLELFLYVFKAMACCLADVPPRIYTGMYRAAAEDERLCVAFRFQPAAARLLRF